MNTIQVEDIPQVGMSIALRADAIIEIRDKLTSNNTSDKITINNTAEYVFVCSSVARARAVLKEWLKGTDGTNGADALCAAADLAHKLACDQRAKYANPLESFIALGTMAERNYSKKIEREAKEQEARLRAEQLRLEQERIDRERKAAEEQQLAEALRLQKIADAAAAEEKRLAEQVAADNKRLADLAEQGRKAEYDAVRAELQVKQAALAAQANIAVENAAQSEAVLSAPVEEPMREYVAPVFFRPELPRVPGYRKPREKWWLIDDENEANIRELCQAVLDRRCVWMAVTRNTTYLGQQANSMKEQFNLTNAFPGVRSSDEQPTKVR